MGREVQDAIEGNRVRIRLLEARSKRTPKLIGFVHNPEADPALPFDLTSEWLAFLGANAGPPAPPLENDRWLVATSARGSSCLEAYRSVCSQSGAALDDAIRTGSLVGAGYLNAVTASGYGSFIGAGGSLLDQVDLQSGKQATGNQVAGSDSFIGAGDQNRITGNGSIIGAGGYVALTNKELLPNDQIAGSDSFIGAGTVIASARTKPSSVRGKGTASQPPRRIA